MTPTPDANASRCPMHNPFPRLGLGLQMLGLALIAGGMLALGAFTAPAVFGNLARSEAGPLMAVIFRRYDMVLLGALGLLLLGEALGRFTCDLKRRKSPLLMTRFILLAGLTGSLLYSTLVVNADIERMNRAGLRRDASVQGQQFEARHKLSENLYKLELLAAMLLILLTPFALPGAKEKA